MTDILDRLNSEDDTVRIEELEVELERLRSNFEEYISTTEGLEGDVKKELREMQSKLNHSTSVNDEYVKKLRRMEGLLRTLELSSDETREKLKTEGKLRRKAEKALTESELELRSKIVKIRQLERSDSSTLRIVDSGIITEMVNNTSKGFTDRELESVTDELITTQEKLRKAEEQLQRSQTLVQDLERNFQNIDNETSQSLPGGDNELLRELDEIRAEIDAARSDIQSQSTANDLGKEHMSNYESQLEENREENSRLIEEIACLRNILYDQSITRIAADEKGQQSRSGIVSTISMEKMVNETKEVHQLEIKSLRKQIEEILNENMYLQEKIKGSLYPEKNIEVNEDEIIQVKFANDLPSYVEDLSSDEILRQSESMLKESQEECSMMRTEILALTEVLYNANQSRGESMVSNQEIIDLARLTGQDDGRIEVEDKNKKISALETDLMSTQEEVRVLAEEISHMSNAFEKAQYEYNFVVEELQQTEDALAAAKDMRFSQETMLESVAEQTPQKNVEMRLLKRQFEKLHEKNESLARQVKDAENEVLIIREKQDEARVSTKARVIIAKELRDDIDQAVNQTNQRNREVQELAIIMENRIGSTERNIEMLESEIALATTTLRNDQVVVSLSEKSTPSASMRFRKDTVATNNQSAEINSKTYIKVDIEKAASDEINAQQSLFEQSQRLLEIGEAVQKLTILSKNGKSDRKGVLNVDDRTTITATSFSTSSIYSDKKNSKYEKIIQRVADYESLSSCSKENRELEAHGDIGIEERE